MLYKSITTVDIWTVEENYELRIMRSGRSPKIILKEIHWQLLFILWINVPRIIISSDWLLLSTDQDLLTRLYLRYKKSILVHFYSVKIGMRYSLSSAPIKIWRTHLFRIYSHVNVNVPKIQNSKHKYRSRLDTGNGHSLWLDVNCEKMACSQSLDIASLLFHLYG